MGVDESPRPTDTLAISNSKVILDFRDWRHIVQNNFREFDLTFRSCWPAPQGMDMV